MPVPRIFVHSAFRRKISVAFALLALIAALVWLRCGPIDRSLVVEADAPSTIVVDRSGAPLYEALSARGVRLERIDGAHLPPTLVSATLAAEDRRFFTHAGIDPAAILRAVRRNLAEREIVEGGSTISQQTAKLLLQRRDGLKARGVRAKLREALLALRLEHRLAKNDILALYLNLASYGNQTSGAARASRLYFGVEPSMLTPAQAAFLAGLPQRPSTFNPWKNINAARVRQRTILHRMRAGGVLTDDQLRDALAERLALDRRHAPFAAPHFVEMALATLGTVRPARLETTLDLSLQREIEGIIDSHRDDLRAHGASNVAVVVLDNARGEWIAWEGSGDYFDADHGGTINGPVVPRQPGSALKPFTYALAFEEGRTPSTVLPDIPSHFATAEAGVLYRPRNYDGVYRGPMLARRALAGSENVPAVALASELGVSSLLRFLTRAGLQSFDRNASYYGVGLTLGNAEVRLDQLVAAYAAFARGGMWRQPVFVRGAPASVHPLVSPRTAFWITDVLSDPEARAFIFGRGGSLEFPFPVAVKTGTSQAYHDNWTIGYTRAVTVGVWVGNFDRRPLRDSSGVTGAGPIFHAVMLAAEQRVAGSIEPGARPIVARPEGLEQAPICTLSGMRANPSCPSRAIEWVRSDAESLPCAWHHQSDDGLLTVYPAEYRAWAVQSPKSVVPGLESRLGTHDARLGTQDSRLGTHDSRLGTHDSRLGTHDSRLGTHDSRLGTHDSRLGTRDSGLRTRDPGLEIVSPPPGAIYSIDPTLRREFQTLPLRVIAASPTRVSWAIDGREVASTSSEHAADWPLAVGHHEIAVTDEDGRRATTSIVVK